MDIVKSFYDVAADVVNNVKSGFKDSLDKNFGFLSVGTDAIELLKPENLELAKEIFI